MSDSATSRGRHRERPRCAHAGAVLACASLAIAVTAPAASASGTTAAKTSSKLSQAVTIALESRYQVVTLHDLAVSLGHKNAIPAGAIRTSAQNLEGTFITEGKDCGSIGASASSPTNSLAISLRTYGQFATELAQSASSETGTISKAFSANLAANDKRWLAALAAISQAAHTNLLKEVPTLLYPTAH
jgi:hypothetical protein